MPAALATSGVLLRVRLAKKGESDMTFIKTVPEAEAAGAVATLYDEDRDTFGDVGNLTMAFSLAPEVAAAWQQLNAALKALMALPRDEPGPVAAPRRPPPTSSM